MTPQILAPTNLPAPGTVTLSSLDVSRATPMWGNPRRDKSVSNGQMKIAGQTFDGGWGSHAPSRLVVRLDRKAKRFTARVGVDDGAGSGRGSVVFSVVGDGKMLWTSGIVRGGEPAKAVDVDISRVQFLTIAVSDGGDGIANDHADWVNARFEGVSGPIAVVERLPSEQKKIVPGAPWRDTKGNLIQAHGGGILKHGKDFYWYGEDRSNGYVAIGISCYVSQNLVDWKPVGVVLPKAAYDAKWKEATIAERPKVIYNPRTKKFVLWFHYDRSGYGDSQAGIAISDAPTGPFRFLGMHRPVQTSTYRDMNLFVDDDGTAYALYAGEENYTLHIVRLNADWTSDETPMSEGRTWIRTLVRAHREAPAPFKHNGRYYLITSAATGWTPNAADVWFSYSMLGEWKRRANPFVGAGSEITFGSQSTFVLPVPNRPGAFIYMGDRWNPQNLADARYVWLPFAMKPDGTFEISWRESWEPKL